MKVSGFGYKNVWFATRGVSPRPIADHLSLEILRECDWHEGVDAAYAFRTDQVFVTPPVKGWVIAVGTGLFDVADPENFHATVQELSRSLNDEVQMFGTHRVVETHSWAKATAGDLQRAYMYVGDRGETVADIGAPTLEERELGFRFSDGEGTDPAFPVEQDVMRLAGLWSLDPTQFEGMELECATGLLCVRRAKRQPKKPWWKLW